MALSYWQARFGGDKQPPAYKHILMVTNRLGSAVFVDSQYATEGRFNPADITCGIPAKYQRKEYKTRWAKVRIR